MKTEDLKTHIKNHIKNFILPKFIYEPNTPGNRAKIAFEVSGFLDYQKREGNIFDFKVVCDESLNTPDVISRNELKLTFALKFGNEPDFTAIAVTVLVSPVKFEEN